MASFFLRVMALVTCAEQCSLSTWQATALPHPASLAVLKHPGAASASGAELDLWTSAQGRCLSERASGPAGRAGARMAQSAA